MLKEQGTQTPEIWGPEALSCLLVRSFPGGRAGPLAWWVPEVQVNRDRVAAGHGGPVTRYGAWAQQSCTTELVR